MSRDQDADRAERVQELLTPDAREGKLPQWAQYTLGKLRRHVNETERKLKSVETKWEKENGELADLYERIERACETGDWSQVAELYRLRVKGE